MKKQTVNLKDLVKIAPDLKFDQLIDLFKAFGIELVFTFKKKKSK